MQYRQAVLKYYQNAGAKVVFDLTGHLPHLKGVGHCETLTHPDGRSTRVILPKMNISRSRTRFTNIKWPPELHRKNGLGLKTIEERGFRDGMPSVSRDCLNGPEYYFEDGLRKVEPYFDCAKSTITEREYPGPGITIMDFYHNRFPSFFRKYFELNLANKQIAVNAEVVDPCYVLKEGDVITSLFHKHENDVIDAEIDIVHDTDELLVVNKPSSWAVYPTGNFKFNTLQYILMKEYGYRDIRTVHRIDAATSGICIMAKKAGVAGSLHKYFSDKFIVKEYLALVDGKFPESEIVCDVALDAYKISPLRISKPAEMKPSKTIFNLLNYNPGNHTSLVRCVPVTGRTHQIRLHLQSLGYYIVHDSLYNPRDFEGERTRLNQKELNQALTNMEKEELPQESNIFSNDYKHKYCLHCQSEKIIPQSQPSFMCLHSHKYSLGDEFVFECSLPAWATRPDIAR